MKRSNMSAFRGGSYSILITAVVLVLAVAVNVFASRLPTTLTKLDISAAKLYSVTSNTKVVVNALQKDVTVYWIVQADQEDSILENLLKKYESLSDRIKVVKKNPDVFPTFAQQYTDETIYNNSLIVECGERYRYISYDEIYLQEADMYSYTYTTSFDGEGAVTSAIDYVVSEELSQLYLLEGHGEGDLPATLADRIEKENMEVQAISLLMLDAIPEDAAALMIYGPQSDISVEEKEMLADFVSGGGKLLVAAGPTEEAELTNLNALLGDYGVTVNEGIVVEADRDHYAFQAPYVLLPDMADSDVTEALIRENYYPILPIASGLTVGSSTVVTELLTTSAESFSKLAGFALETYDKEEGDIDGPFALAVSVAAGSGEILWFSSSVFLEDMYNAYSSGANVDLAMNALSSLTGEREAISIRSKSLNYNYLTISESEGAALKTVLIGVLPLTYLAIGLFVFAITRRKQNEAV